MDHPGGLQRLDVDAVGPEPVALALSDLLEDPVLRTGLGAGDLADPLGRGARGRGENGEHGDQEGESHFDRVPASATGYALHRC